MRQEDRAPVVVIAVPVPFLVRANLVGTTRRMIANAPGTPTDVGTAIIYSLVFWALLLFHSARPSVDRFIAARIPARRRISS